LDEESSRQRREIKEKPDKWVSYIECTVMEWVRIRLDDIRS